MTHYVGLYNYWVVIFLMMTGFYIVIARSNLIQKVIGLNIFQISVFLLYITMGKVTGGTAPILPYHHSSHATHGVQLQDHVAQQDHVEDETESVASQSEADPSDPTTEAHPEEAGHAPGDAAEPRYTHPLPSVLMLTAIVVGVATTALALALVIRIGEAYGTIEEDEILELDREAL